MSTADLLVALAIAAAALVAGFLVARGDRRFRTGFAYGAALFGLVGVLTFWALRDARPRGDGPMTGGDSVRMGRPPAPPTAAADTDQGLAGRIRSLDDHIVANPEDLEARRELGYVLLSAGRFFDADGQAGQILARSPGDVDALYIQGVARLSMGDREAGRRRLEEVVAAEPGHVHALVALGTVHLQGGDRDTAIAAWEQALAATGGAHPGLERLIARARQGLPVEEVLASPG